MKSFLLFLLLFPFLGVAQEESTIDTLKVTCDAIYAKKGFSILHIKYEFEADGYTGEKNSVFIFRKVENGKSKEIYRDTIFSRIQEINFEDYNNDKVKDILIQHIDDVRSNSSYTLYLVNPKTYSLTKVKGFGEIKNPYYNAKYNIVESRVSSGTDYTAFYKIIKSRVYDYKIIVYNNHEDNDNFDRAYDKAIKKIIKKNKTLSKR
jgi:hypothetical protein